MFNAKYKNRGFTLIEVIISICILIIVLVPILSMTLSSVKNNKSAEDKQKSLYIAQKYVEDFKKEEGVQGDGGKYGKKSGEVKIRTEDRDVEGFHVKADIYELYNYNFPEKKDKESKDNENEQHKVKTFDSINYDIKLLIHKDKQLGLQNVMEVYRYKDIDENRKLSLKQYESDDPLNDLKIINNSENITVNLNGDEYNLNKYDVEEGKNSSEVIIVIGKGSEAKFDIEICNNCKDKNLIIYFASETEKKVSYIIEDGENKRKKYSNMILSDRDTTNNGRVYKMNVVVKKEKTILQEVTAYKNMAK